jgi:hypothetical protein
VLLIKLKSVQQQAQCQISHLTKLQEEAGKKLVKMSRTISILVAKNNELSDRMIHESHSRRQAEDEAKTRV